MKILFLTIARIQNISERGIYTDLIRKFRDEGHKVYIACPAERRYQEKTSLKVLDGVTVLSIYTLNAQKTSLIEKGICTMLIDGQFKRAIKNHFNAVPFDLVLYSTPPITFTNTIKYVKQKNKAITYLLLKDIFPQNAVDLGMISKWGLIHSYFRKKEKILYSISDFIGCLSPENVTYLLKHNPEIDLKKVEVNPNTIYPLQLYSSIKTNKKQIIHNKYKIPENAVVFIYGGNLGKPQGIDFVIKVLSSNINNYEVFFLIIGSGTEYKRLLNWYNKFLPQNTKIISALPKDEYDELLLVCDVGLVFLDDRFTIPNFPSRLLSYLENKLPILAATDINTDFGRIIVDAECGFWVKSGDILEYNNKIHYFINNPSSIKKMGNRGFDFLNNNYTVDISYKKIIEKVFLVNKFHKLKISIK